MSQPDPRDETAGGIRNYIGVALLVLAFCVSLVVSVVNTLRVERPDKTVIRIAHWQLERGYREAMQQIIDEYEKLHPGVKIEQMGVAERVYNQWINTHLISGTAPDICEMGHSNMLTKDEYTVKYFLPLSNIITQPNPYNKGTDLEGVPWKETLLDGMRGGFREGLQEYYGVPTTLISMRLFYNKRLLKAATGSDEAPKSFGEWMKQCEQIRAYAKANDPRILPIVSCYKTDDMQGTYTVAFTSAAMEQALDLDLNGDITALETYIGYRSGKVSMDDPGVVATYETVRKIGEQMQQGFSSMDRQQAQYKFVNELAGFMFTGSWDTKGTYSQAATRGFDVGVCEVPLPAPGEQYGDLVRGRRNEAGASGSCAYGLYKRGKNIDQATDFLMFITSRMGNEKFNHAAQWPPLARGAEPLEVMIPFQPNPVGYNANIKLSFGSGVGQVLNGQTLNYLQGDIPYDEFKKSYNEVIADPRRGGDWAWWFEYDTLRRDLRNKERVLAQDATLELIYPGTRDQARYRRALLQQVIRNNAMDSLWLFRTKRKDKDGNPLDPTKVWSDYDFQKVFP